MVSTKKTLKNKVKGKIVSSKKPNNSLPSKEKATFLKTEKNKPFLFEKKSFTQKIQERLIFNTYFDYLLFLSFILMFVIFCNFIIKFFVFTIAPKSIILYLNLSPYYFWYNFLFVIVFLFVYFIFSHEASRINLSLNNFSKSVVNLSLFLIFFEALLLTISYFSYISEYVLLFNITSNFYLLYLISLLFIKYFLFFIFSLIIFYIFEKLKGRC